VAKLGSTLNVGEEKEFCMDTNCLYKILLFGFSRQLLEIKAPQVRNYGRSKAQPFLKAS
jgi:hypothetical protein